MNIKEMNWQQVEDYLQDEDRAILPLGCTEQHAYLSLNTDAILAEKLAQDCASDLNIAVFPVVNYGVTPAFSAYPGTISLRVETLVNIVRDILDGLKKSGFKRIIILNGHGGNSAARMFVQEWLMDNPSMKVKWHDWWEAPKVWQKVEEIDPDANHASWMENFPWTRIANLNLPKIKKEMLNSKIPDQISPKEVRDYLGDGSYGGAYYKDDSLMAELWQIAIEEARALLTDNWDK